MPIHILKLVERHLVAKDTLLLMFEKPANFNFKAGQYGGFTLINPTETDAGGITRRFSLLSSPEDKHLAILTRIQQSAFKRVLNTLPLGGEIKFAGPTGQFILHEDPTIPAVLIAGGIGIAPFYSIICTETTKQSAQPLTLFYGNQSNEDAVFLNELAVLERVNPHFQLVSTLAKPHKDWTGETGFITDTMIKKYVPDLAAPLYYICGSPAMVTVLQETLAEMGIDEDRIRVEDFPGY